jgi:polyphosphate kinase
MAKDHKQGKQQAKQSKGKRVEVADAAPIAEPKPRMSEKEYQKELRRLHAELVACRSGSRPPAPRSASCSRGATPPARAASIKAITERVSPRVFRVVALPAPTEREKSQMYVQRYMAHFPAAGEVVIFDRSWYNRAGVERVMGFCTARADQRFLRHDARCGEGDGRLGHHPDQVLAGGEPGGADPSAQRRIDDPRKVWKLTDMDLQSYTKWFDYSEGARCHAHGDRAPSGRPGSSR